MPSPLWLVVQHHQPGTLRRRREGASTPSKPTARFDPKRKLCALQDLKNFAQCEDRFRPISELGRQTLAHADARFDLIPGLLIEPNNGRVGFKDLQIDLDAAERRQTPFSFQKQRLSNPFMPMRSENGDSGNPTPMSFVSSHHRADNEQAFERDQHHVWLKAHFFCNGGRSFVPRRIIWERLLPKRFDASEMLVSIFRDYWHRASCCRAEATSGSSARDVRSHSTLSIVARAHAAAAFTATMNSRG